MFTSSILLAAAAVLGVASAQNGSASCAYYNNSGVLSFPPSCVDQSLRNSWCLGETSTCPELCENGQTANGGNTCDPSQLTYNCTCANGIQPNVSNYAATLPSYICAQWQAYCTNAHPNDAAGQAFCQSFVCGHANASEALSGGSSSSSSASSSATSSPSSTGSGSGSAESTASTTSSGSGSESSAPSSTSGGSAAATSSGAAMALQVGMQYGTGILATAMLAVFGLAL